MRRLLTGFLLLLLCAPQVVAWQHKSGSENDGLKGKVKSVLEEIEGIPDSPYQSIPRNRHPIYMELYNEQGDLTEFLTDLNPSPKHSPELDAYFPDGSKAFKSTPIPHTPPPTVNASPTGNSTTTHWYQDKYDSKGNRIESVLTNRKGTFEERRVFRFDNQGNQISTEAYSAEGKLEYRTSISYNENGREKETAIYKDDGTLLEKYAREILEEDSRGNWTQRKDYKLNIATGVFEPYCITYRTITYYE